MSTGPIRPFEKETQDTWIQNFARTDLFACDNAASFLQSGFWGAFKARFGWEELAFEIEWKSGVKKFLLVLRRRLAPFFALVYVPWGPELPENFPNEDVPRGLALKELALALGDMLPKDTAFIRFDPPWPVEDSKSLYFPAPFTRSAVDIQAPDTVILDLSKSLESLTAEMKPKWRYNIGLARKKGVTVSQNTVDKLPLFYELLKETAQRDGIVIHSFEYYRVLFENDWYSGKKPDIRLYLAEHDGDLLAGIVTLFWKKEAVYLYGASSNKKRNLMAPYALQAKALEDARKLDCRTYDLFGIPPTDDPNHPMKGLYLFKTGFGGTIVHKAGSWDYPYRPLIYRILRFAEKLQRKLRR